MIWTLPRASAAAGLLGTLLWLAPSAASALSFEIGFAGGNTTTFTDADAELLGCGPAGEGTLCQGGGAADDGVGLSGPSGGWLIEQWSIYLDPDPTVSNNLVIVNNTGVTQTVIATVILPIAPPFGPPSLIRGSVVGGATDLNGNGVAIATPGGGSLYEAFIDGVSVRTLLDDPFSSSTGSAFGSTPVPVTNYGIPVQEVVGVATSTNIALRLTFNLSAGDSASLTSVFNVEPVPEPSTALLVGGGLLALMGVSRRMRR